MTGLLLFDFHTIQRLLDKLQYVLLMDPIFFDLFCVILGTKK